MPLRTVRVRQACFVCGDDVPLERFLHGLPCEDCEDKRHRILIESQPPRVVQLLAQQYQRITGASMPRVWIPWISAVAAHESLRIPLWPAYRPLDLFLLLAGSSRRPAILVVSEGERRSLESPRLLQDKRVISDRLPGEHEVLITLPNALGQIREAHRFAGFLFWLHPDPAPEPSAFPSAVLVIADAAFPYPRLHGFQGWLSPGQEPPEPEARVLDVPVIHRALLSLPPETLLHTLFLLLPFLPVDLQELVASLHLSRSLDAARAQVLREAVSQALDHQGLRDILENLGFLHARLTLQVPDTETLRHQLDEAHHPARRGPLYLVDPALPRGRYLTRRGFLPYPPPLQQRPPLAPPRDTATLLIFVGDLPSLRDLGFHNLWRRRALGLDLLEGMGTLGPVTLLRIPPLFRWVDRHLYPDVGLLKAVRTLARRYPRVTLMVPEPLKYQGILLLAALEHLWNRRRLLLYSDLVHQRFHQVSPEEGLEALRQWVQRHLVTVEHRQALRSAEIPRAPSSWQQEAALVLIQRAQETPEPRRQAWVTLDGLTLRVPVPDEVPDQEAEARIREESQIHLEPGEFSVDAPPPSSPGSLLEEKGLAPDGKTLYTLLWELWKAGMISHPYRAVPVQEYQEVAHVLLEERGIATPVAPSPATRGLVPTRPLLDLDLRALTSRFRLSPATVPVYRHILLRFLAQFLPQARVQATRIRLVTPFGTAEALKAQRIVDVGFTALLPLPLEFGVVYPDLQITRVRIQVQEIVGLSLRAFVDHWFFHAEENPPPLMLLRSLEPWVREYQGRLLLTAEGHRLLRRLPSELVEP